MKVERLEVLGTVPLSAARGSGDLAVTVVSPKDGLLGVIVVHEELSCEGMPWGVKMQAVRELVRRWRLEGWEDGGEFAMAWSREGKDWWVSLPCEDMREASSQEAWWQPKWPGCRDGSWRALHGMFGQEVAQAGSMLVMSKA